MRYPFSKWKSRFLATRDRGREVREDIERELAKLPLGETLILDFSDVDAITHSFGDECIGKLLLARTAGDLVDRGLIAEGMSEDIRETIELVVDRRKVALATNSLDGGPEILGQPLWLNESLQEALKLRSFRAIELAEALGITAPAANNRLKLIVGSGAVLRERSVPDGGGKEFTYKIAVQEYA